MNKREWLFGWKRIKFLFFFCERNSKMRRNESLTLRRRNSSSFRFKNKIIKCPDRRINSPQSNATHSHMWSTFRVLYKMFVISPISHHCLLFWTHQVCTQAAVCLSRRLQLSRIFVEIPRVHVFNRQTVQMKQKKKTLQKSGVLGWCASDDQNNGR